jgi:hypothetical protein
MQQAIANSSFCDSPAPNWAINENATQMRAAMAATTSP